MLLCKINLKNNDMKTKKTTYYECIYKGINMLCYKSRKYYYLLGNHIGKIQVKEPNEIGKQNLT